MARRLAFAGPPGPQGPAGPTGPAGDLTQAAADTRYVNVSGDTMTGDLIVTKIQVKGNSPIVEWREDDAPADEKYWRIVPFAGRWTLQTVDDAYANAVDAFSIDRGGTGVLAPRFPGLSGTGTRVVEASSNGSLSATRSMVPTGGMVAWAGPAAPSGWLLCDGAAISRTTFSDLFAAIGIAYGAGNGSTTFNVPNMKGRIPVGLDAAQTEFDTLAETGGEKTHTMTTGEMPTHNHTELTIGNSAFLLAGGSAAFLPVAAATTTGNAGSGNAHNNLQPYVVSHWIIKT